LTVNCEIEPSFYEFFRSSMLSRNELDRFDNESVDPHGWGPVCRGDMNRELSDYEICRRIEERTEAGRPTYLLRLEYDRRLRECDL